MTESVRLLRLKSVYKLIEKEGGFLPPFIFFKMLCFFSVFVVKYLIMLKCKLVSFLRKVEQFEVDYRELCRAPAEHTKHIKAVFDWFDSVIYALLAIFVIFAFLFRLVGVSGQSMEPTLHNGDWLAVRAVNTKINRGEIVVVTQPNKLNEPIIKRVIAVAGDTVDIDFRTGKVTVNGVVSDEPYIAEKTERSFDTSFPLTVPQNCVFVMGVNRNHSLDSRSSVIGFIDTRYILGVAEFRLIPVGDWKIDSNGK